MCEKCDQKIKFEEHNLEVDGVRRRLLVAGTTLGTLAAAGPALTLAGRAVASEQPSGQVKAWGVTSIKEPVQPMMISRRQPGPEDVEIEIIYAGICHSDIHTAQGDWGPIASPCVPGHEIVGRVSAVGSKVTRFKVGDIGGVGCMVDSCGVCENCLNDREQNCLNGTTFTYGSEDKISGGHTLGGYATKVVVKERFVLNIPESMDLARVAPILCAGITTFSPMEHWQLKKGQKVGVIGIGGLGHMAVKLAVARGAEVIAFTTSPNKVKSIEAMGAKAVLWNEQEAMGKLAFQLDLMISTVPVPFEMQPFINLLKLDATLVNVGQLGTIDGISGMSLVFGRRSVAGSLIGGIAETQEVINFCAEHDILPDIELIKPNQINEAWQRVKGKDIQYRFVIDMRSA